MPYEALPDDVVHAVQSFHGARWCNRSIPHLFRCSTCAQTDCGTWDCAHGVMPSYSLMWHEMVRPLAEALRAARTDAFPYLGSGDVYGFGMAHGHTVRMLYKALPNSRYFGFDSYHGLPAEDDHNSTMAVWRQGNFKPHRWATPEYAEALGGGRRRAVVTPGFFDRTLTPKIVKAHNMSQALYIDVDCDLHSSTSTVLAWLLSSRLLAVGTLVGFDDFWVIPCNHYRISKGKDVVDPLSVGEGKAHHEAVVQHGLRYVCVGGPCRPPPSTRHCHVHNHFAPIFLLVASGVPPGQEDNGFDFGSSAQMAEFMRSSRACASLRDMRR